MDAFNFCWMTLINEAKKSNVFFDKNTCNVRNDVDENFNKPLNRISYLYKFGSYNIHLFHQCFKEFFMKVPNSPKIIDDFLCIQNLTICSMSAGPGTDIIGLLYTLYLIDKPLVNSTAFKAISKQGSWRNLVTQMINSSIISVPESSTCHLVECDFLKDFSKRAQGYLKSADILLMCNSFSSSTPEKVVCDTLKRAFQLLKPTALVFMIFCKEKSSCFKELLTYGSFLFGPVEVTLKNMPYNENIAELVGVRPLSSGSSLFAVWQKTCTMKQENNFFKETENSLPVGINQDSSMLSTANLKRKLLNDTIRSSSDNLGNILCQIKNKSENNSVNFNKQNADSFETNFNHPVKNESIPVNASDSLVGKMCGLPLENNQKRTEKNGSMSSLLKNFEDILTKFEGLISCEDSIECSSVKEKQLSSSLKCHQCSQMHQSNCRCSVKSCPCCHELCHEDINNIKNCSIGAACNLYRFLPQKGPCLVIPLKSLSNESLAHILSIVSQNDSVIQTTSNLFPTREKN